MADRVVVVRGALQGTGILLTPTLVLTAAHVVGHKRTVEVIHPDGTGWTTCHVHWRGKRVLMPSTSTQASPAHAGNPSSAPLTPAEEAAAREDTEREAATHTAEVGSTHTLKVLPMADLAILQADDPIVQPDSPVATRRLRWGVVDTGQPMKHCQIVGFPQVQRNPETDGLELDQYAVTVLPVAGSPRPTLTCEFANPPAIEPPDGRSLLSGLSGAPVFAGETLLGVVSFVPLGRGHLRIEAVPLSLLPTSLPEREALPPAFEEITDFHPRDEVFTEQYAQAVRSRYREIEIFGIDELSTDESRWDLDIAYLHLEAESVLRGRPGADSTRAVQRIDEVLDTTARAIVLRGEAGAGKTTLVWWLAAHAAAGTLGPRLAHLNGLVPLVIPMRSLRAQGGVLPSPSGLANVASLVTDNPPEGWARRVLTSGRGLLLVDGLDEVPQDDRDDVRRWLDQLLDAFGGTRCLVTMRPLAVQEEWLRPSHGVLEVRLLPMRDPDIRAFVHCWHNAARPKLAGSAEDLAALTDLENDLLRQLDLSAALRDLARSPLLCAVICALHRKRRGLLPTGRAALYKAALEMLLGMRDAQRRVRAPEGVHLDGTEHMLLLQRIAIWLVRNGQSQLSHEQAAGQLQLALKGMPQVAGQGSPEKILKHVLARSGLLQLGAEDGIQFIHRTFQDYLAAKEFRDSDNLGELLLHAGAQEWEDVIRLVVGQCGPAEIERVVRDLIGQGDRHQLPARRSVHLLAAHCAVDAVYLDESTRDMVTERVRALLPPTSFTVAAEIGALGVYLLPLLPAPAMLDPQGQIMTAEMLARIGGHDCLPAMRELGQQPSAETRHRVALYWQLFPAEDYATEVLARMKLSDVRIRVSSAEHLPHLKRLPGLTCLSLDGEHLPRGSFAVIHELTGLRELHLSDQVWAVLPAAHANVARLSIDIPKAPVDGLADWTALRGLSLHQPVALPMLFDQLARMPRLSGLHLPLASPVVALEALPVLQQIRSLVLPSLAEGSDLRQVARVFPGLTRLTVHPKPATAWSVDLHPFAEYPRLTVEVVRGGGIPILRGAEGLARPVILRDATPEEEARRRFVA